MDEVRIRTRHHGIVYQQTLFDIHDIQPVSPKRAPEPDETMNDEPKDTIDHEREADATPRND